MNHSAGIAVAACALLWSASGAAQTYKCADAAGKITYSSSPCGELGMKDAGEVRNQINIAPAQKVAPMQPAPAPAARPAPAAAAKAPAKSEPPADMPADTLVDQGREDGKRCFTVKTAKGTATRCNDKPD